MFKKTPFCSKYYSKGSVIEQLHEPSFGASLYLCHQTPHFLSYWPVKPPRTRPPCLVVQVKSPSSSGVSRGFQPCVSRRPPAGKRGRTARRVLGLLRILRFLRSFEDFEVFEAFEVFEVFNKSGYYMKKDSLKPVFKNQREEK